MRFLCGHAAVFVQFHRLAIHGRLSFRQLRRRSHVIAISHPRPWHPIGKVGDMKPLGICERPRLLKKPGRTCQLQRGLLKKIARAERTASRGSSADSPMEDSCAMQLGLKPRQSEMILITSLSGDVLASWIY